MRRFGGSGGRKERCLFTGVGQTQNTWLVHTAQGDRLIGDTIRGRMDGKKPKDRYIE